MSGGRPQEALDALNHEVRGLSGPADATEVHAILDVDEFEYHGH